ncbi:MAG: hypothetical protein KF688_10150 [Pirellulales bacterium]|nr:hypothetical protein [Pirellulales bacterium]
MTAPESNADRERMLEQIVAYLDGELSPSESAEIERRLARDEEFRQEMQGIERAWAALDDLPRTTLDDRFARTTMEMVVSEAANEVAALTAALPVVRRKRQWSRLLAGAAAGLLAFLAVRIVRDAPNRALLADLPVVRNVDSYSQLPGVDGSAAVKFLTLLGTDYGAELRAATVSGGDLSEEAAELARLGQPTERRAWLAGLSPEASATLAAQADRFAALAPKEQQRLRAINDAVFAPEAPTEELFETLVLYRRWLSLLPASKQFELRKLPDDERLAEIGIELAQRTIDEALELNEEELRRLNDALRRAFADLGPGRGGPNNRSSQRWQRSILSIDDRNGDLAKELVAKYAQVKDALPERTKEVFENLEPWEQRNQLAKWARQWISMQGEVSRQDLEEFFVEHLDDAERTRLLALPADEMETQLEQLYRGTTQRRGFGPGPQGGPGDPRGGRRGGPPWRPGEGFGDGPDRPGGPGGPPPPEDFEEWAGRGFGRGPGSGPGPGRRSRSDELDRDPRESRPAPPPPPPTD